MINPEQIPDEVVKEALWAYNYASRDCYTTEEQDIAIAIAAALNAWPGMRLGKYRDVAGDNDRIILPLTQQDSDE